MRRKKALIPIIYLLPDSKYVCFVIPRLFTQQECNDLLTGEIKHSFRKANSNYPTYYRNNDRLVIDDEIFSRKLFKKVCAYLPQTIQINDQSSIENGTWQLHELNNRIRFCRYQKEQYFNRHLDGVHFRSEQLQSKLTFMLYLNGADEFTGGRTLFYESKESTQIWASYLPEAGDLIVFDHHIWHEGEKLISGEKFVLRSDILYIRKSAREQSQPVLKNYHEGHLGYIWKLLLFNAHTLLSAGRDTLIKVWNGKGECIQRLSGHQQSVLCLEKLNTNTILSGSRDRSIKVWKQENGIFFLKSNILIHQATVLSLCKIDDNTFASSGGDHIIHICSVEGTLFKTLTGHTDWVWHIIKLNEGILASCSEDKTIRIWDYQKGACIAQLQENSPVQCLVFDTCTLTLISGNFNGEISIYTPDTDFTIWKRVNTFKAHTGIIRTLAILDMPFLASGAEDNKVRIWHTTNSTQVAEFHHSNFVQSLAVPEKNQLISSSYDGQIRLWMIGASSQ